MVKFANFVYYKKNIYKLTVYFDPYLDGLM